MKRFLTSSTILLALTGCATTTTDQEYARDFEKAVSAHEPAMDACFKKYGSRKDMRVTVNFRANYAGDIQFVEIDPTKSEGSNAAFDDCILAAFRTVKMPESQGHDGARGSYTLRNSAH